MIVYQLTQEQMESIQGVFFLPNTFFNCVQDANEIYCMHISEIEKEEIVGTQWEWILSLPEAEWVPPTFDENDRA